MPRIHTIFLLLLFTLGLQSVQGQNETYPWGAGAGVRMLAYQAPPGQASLGGSLYNPVGTLLLGRYLNSAFDFRTQANFGPAVRFPVPEGGAQQTWMVDMSYLMVFKFHNGVILPETFPVSPYLMAGLGGSYVPNHPDAFFPMGVGLRVRISPRINLHLETTRQISLNGDYQHLAHAVALIFNFGTPAEEEPTEEEEETENLEPIDSDGDGVPDESDLCPDEPGTKDLQGCPDFEPAEEPQEATPLTAPTASSPPTSTGAQTDSEELFFPPAEGSATPTELDFTAESPDNETNSPCNTLEQTSLPTLYFSFGSDEVDAKNRATLDQIAEKLQACEDLSLVLRGYTNDMGNERENKVLSVMRAYRVKYYLVYEHGISQVRITSNGLSATSAEDRQGRRVEMQLVR